MMTEVYLFDWGDTLMVDFPGVPGKMCDWDKVQAMDGAKEALSSISRRAQVYVATGAAESTETEIEAAFSRVELDQFISGYFCKANLGIEKGTSAFLPSILSRLAKQPHQITVVGDSFKKDIEPALALGIHAIWLNSDKSLKRAKAAFKISSLRELGLPV
jgi:FMN phosphatase YigB (HAD superfamily)